MQNWEVPPKPPNFLFQALYRVPHFCSLLRFLTSWHLFFLHHHLLSIFTVCPRLCSLKHWWNHCLLRSRQWPFITCLLSQINFALFILLTPINNGLYQMGGLGFLPTLFVSAFKLLLSPSDILLSTSPHRGNLSEDRNYVYLESRGIPEK